MPSSELPANPSTNPIPHRGPLAAALVLTLVTIAIGFWLHTRLAAQQAESMTAFDLNAAMLLAGNQVPAEIDSFYFFTLEYGAPDESGELALKLTAAADEHEFLGIAGADPEHNLSVLLTALAAPRERNLSGLVIIYVGPAGQAAEVLQAVTPSGAELRFVPYTPAAAPSPPSDKII